MIGTPLARSAGRIACNGLIGARSGERSAPSQSTHPPGAQKSFCISTTIMAERARSTVMFCGSAEMLAGSGSFAGIERSTCDGLTFHA